MIKNKIYYLSFAFCTLIIFLLVINPYLMITPGQLTPGHQSIRKNCNECHSYFKGAESDRCLTCHKQEQIGIKLADGRPNPSYTDKKIIFHSQLKNNDCINGHTEHEGKYKNNLSVKFRHEYLDNSTKDKCNSCHVKPDDVMHVSFNDNCSKCHASEKWKPSSFDHNKYFVFDKDHPSECNNCHKNTADYKYTCYGCHEHSEAEIKNKHLEEGINNYQNCVECHRSGDKEEAENKYKKESGKDEEEED